MNKSVAILIGLVLIAVLVAFNTTYTISFHEVGVKTRFGEILGVDREPGLHVKAPFFIDRVAKLDTRLQLLESSLDTVATSDTQQVVVQAFLLWRVNRDDDAGIQSFFKQYGNAAAASRYLQQQLQSALRSGIGKFRFDDLIGESGNLQRAEESILAELKKSQPPGVEIASVGVAKVVLPAKISVAVLERMQAEQQGRAQKAQAEGAAIASSIRSRAANEAEMIKAFARERATQIRTQGDAEAAQYYQTLKQGEELAKFLAWLSAFEDSFNSNTTVIFDSSKAPFHLINADSKTSSGGIPQPAASWSEGSPSPASDETAKTAAPQATPKDGASNG